MINENLTNERYLSKTPFLTFVYLSKYNTNLPDIFGNSKKCFLCTGLVNRDSSKPLLLNIELHSFEVRLDSASGGRLFRTNSYEKY